MKRKTKRETDATTIDDNPRPHLPPPLPPPHGILGLRKWVLGLRRGESKSKPKNQSETEEKQDGERVDKSDIEERERINQIKKHIQ